MALADEPAPDDHPQNCGFTMMELAMVLIATGLAALAALTYQDMARSAAIKNALAQTRTLAEQGNVKAQDALGNAYYKGNEAVPQDYAEAFKWYSKSAEGGDEDAPYRIAMLYDYGRGMANDAVHAYMWYDIAAAYGNPYAVSKREALKRVLTSERQRAAQELSQQWQKQHPMTATQHAQVENKLQWNRKHASLFNRAAHDPHR